jgi:peptide/nickel transport system ATP-binding protein
MAKVVDGVNLTVRKGETVTIVGETGCGKSLTAKCVLDLLPASATVSGHVYFKGQDLLILDEKEHWKLRSKEISLVPQDPMSSLNPVFTIGEQMKDMIEFRGKSIGILKTVLPFGRKEGESETTAIDVLEKLGLSSPERVLKSYPFELSGGMRQRVLIGMALLTRPSLLIADEPGSALDVTTQDKLNQLLMEQVRKLNLSLLFITHSLGVARQISNRIYVMYAGMIVEMADGETILVDPEHPYTAGLIRAVPKLTEEKPAGIRGRIPDYSNPPEGCRFHPRCEHAMDICRREKPSPVELEKGHLVYCHLHDKR